LQMCRDAWTDGVQMSTALAHQNPRYPANTPARIRDAARELTERLRGQQLGLTVFASAEIMVGPQFEAAWKNGGFLTMADRGQYLLVEMPHGQFLDLLATAQRLAKAGVRLIIAHAERYPELLHTSGMVEEWIAAGCLIQISSPGVTEPPNR